MLINRMRRLLVLLGLALWTAACAAAPRVHHVVIVSLDGGRPAIMRESKMPEVTTLAQEGACTWAAQTIMPSITLVSHTSMLTGVGPEKHHITWNSWMPEKGVVTVPTIFSLARAKGLSTALFAGKEKFEHLHLPGSLNTFLIFPRSQSLARLAADYLEVVKPNLCFVHFTDTDSTGHKYGWGSPEQKDAFAQEDAAIATLRQAIVRAGLADDTVLIVTADHGGHDKTHGSNSPEDMTIPWIAWGAGVKRGEITAPVTTYDTAATALWLLDVPIPDSFDGKPVTSAFTSQ